MAEHHTALDRHTCPACGAAAEWIPRRRCLACRHCGTEAPGELDRDSGKIVEIDLVRTLRDLPEELRGWNTEKQSVRCGSCHAVSVFDPGRVGQNCEFCGSPELLDYEEIRAPIRPRSVLPFRVSTTAVRESIRRWFGGRWFAPRRFRRDARIDTVRGMYIPYWTFDAQVHCPWRALSGTYYYVNRSHRDRSGRTRTRRVRKVRWRPAAGEIDHFFDDHTVPATRGIDPALISRVEPFPIEELVPYDTGYVSGFVVEHYQVVLFDAAQQARESMDQRLRVMCAREVPGDTHRDLRIDPSYTGQTFKSILVPVWLLAFNHGKRSYQVVVNGSTGEIAGRYPRSVWKIVSLVLAIVTLLGLLLTVARAL